MTRRRSSPSRRSGGLAPIRVAWLALVLLLSQGIGLLHHTVHGDRGPASSIAHTAHLDRGAALVANAAPRSTAAQAADGHPPHAPAAPWLERLFGGADHGAVCQLYDQLGHADGLVGQALAWMPQAWVPADVAAPGGRLIAAQATGFLARGPPHG